MIRLLVRLPIVLLFLGPLSWLGVLWHAGDPAVLVGDVFSDLGYAYPEPGERGRIVGESAVLARRAAGLLGRLGAGPSPQIRAGLVVSAVHERILVRTIPLLLALGAAGVTGGLLLRERLRNAEGYASPTAAGLARALVGAGLFGLGLFGLTPIGVGIAWIYGPLLAVSLGGLIYAANLPLKV